MSKKFKLREYQKKDTNLIVETFKTHNSVLYQLPTGGGKTVIIQELVDRIIQGKIKTKSKKILILVHRREIIFQINKRLTEQGIDNGVLIGDYEDNVDSDILVGSILTVARDARLSNIMKRDFDYMVIDEAHHACSNSYVKAIVNFKERNKDYKLLGVTATPHRKDKKQLSKVFDALVLGPTISELQEQGYLCKADTYMTDLEDLDKIDITGGDYKIGDLSKYMRRDEIINSAIQSYKDKGNNKQMLVFCVDKKHSEYVKQCYISKGYKADHIDSHTPKTKRKNIIEKYGKGELDIITSIQTLTEGVDLPETGVIQFLRPTLSMVLYLQMGGRGLRPKKDKSNLIVLDVANCSQEHGLLDRDRDWNLNGGDPNQDKKKNKVVGVTPEGEIVEDLSEIDESKLKLIELTPEEYFMRKQGGIQEAENQNNEIKTELWKAYEEFIDELNKEIKLPKGKFGSYREKEQMIEGTSNYDRVYFKLDKSCICELKFQPKYEKQKQYIKLKNEVYSSSWDNDIESDSLTASKYIILGKIAEMLAKKSKQNRLVKAWKKILDIKENIVDVTEIENQIHEFELKQVLHTINLQFSKGNHKIKLKNRQYGHTYFRDIWGYFDEVVFNDTPRKLRGVNNVTLLDGGNYKGSVSSFNKDDVIRMVQRSNDEE